MGYSAGRAGGRLRHMENCWTGELVRLRPAEERDYETFHRWDQDTEGARHGWQVNLPRTLEATRTWAQERARGEPGQDLAFLVIETLDGTAVGTMNIHSADRRNGTFEYGITVAREFQGHGYANEAIRLVLRFYFEQLRYEKANATVYAFNEPSLALHRKLGFTEEGRLRRMVFTNGAHHDELWFGMTAEEWARRTG